jgi:polysaccharide deacetylase family protein (PEP-CTERM system associated)
MGTSTGRHAFTVDVEDYYQVLNFQRRLPRASWSEQQPRVDRNTRVILDLLDRHNIRATFFVLGCVAEEHPDLVREIARRGHEVGSHGQSHTPLTALSRREFLDEARQSRMVLQDLTGQPIQGFRAPSFSIFEATLWGLDGLLEAGYVYDSSVFPIRHPDYGIPSANPRIHFIETPQGGRILEFPMTTVTWMGRSVPISGGGYFRLFPYSVTKWGWRRIESRGYPGVFYLHPWEVDPEQPNLRPYTSKLGAFRHYTGLRQTLPRLERLLTAHRFGTMASVLKQEGFDLSTESASQPVGQPQPK